MNEGIEHLGGYSEGEFGDLSSYYPTLWKYVIDDLKIKSVLDVGCGTGVSTKFFKDNGCYVCGVDGHPYCIQNSRIKEDMIQNDYTISSASTPRMEYDLCWSCEFVEHVEEQYSKNFLKDFAKCKYVLMSFATVGQGGYHHVNCQEQQYWIDRLEDYGFRLNADKTTKYREIAEIDSNIYSPNFTGYFVKTGTVFIKQ